MKKLIFPLLFICVIFIACDDTEVSQTLYTYSEKGGDTISLANQTTLIMNCKNGNIEIAGTDTTNKMYISVTKSVRSNISQVEAREHMDDIIITTTEKSDEIEITVDHPEDNQLDYFEYFSIILPMTFDFDITNGNGTLSLYSTSQVVNVVLENGDADINVNLTYPCFMIINIGNGSADVVIPDTTSALVHASVGNGTVSHTGLNFYDFQSGDKQFSGKIGNGNGAIVIEIGNGNIMLSGK